MIFAIVISIVMVVVSVYAATTGPVWPLWRQGPFERRQPDYARINRMEIELGIPPSNYSAQGVDGIGLLVADADRRLREAEQASEEIEDQLNPMRVTRRTIASAMAVPSHQMGKTKLLEGCPACGGGHLSTDDGGDYCARCGWSPWGVPPMIQPMDEPYPVTIIQPGEIIASSHGLPRLSAAQKRRRLEEIWAMGAGDPPRVPTCAGCGGINGVRIKAGLPWCYGCYRGLT